MSPAYREGVGNGKLCRKLLDFDESTAMPNDAEWANACPDTLHTAEEQADFIRGCREGFTVAGK